MERGAITPKTAEQMNMTVKGLRWPVEVGIRLMQMQLKYKSNLPPVSPHLPVLRQLLGLPEMEAPRR